MQKYNNFLIRGNFPKISSNFPCCYDFICIFANCEIKVKLFQLEFAGKLNYYVNAVDELLKTDDDNPTIGLLVCSDMDKTDVQWSFRGISTPMGVATYNNIRIKDALPSQEQLAERVRLLQKELQETKRLKNKNNEGIDTYWEAKGIE